MSDKVWHKSTLLTRYEGRQVGPPIGLDLELL